MTTDTLGLYIHIPFCVRKCNYCDFASFGGASDELRQRYIARLKEEILSYSERTSLTVDSIFFGGGTPSLLTAGELEDILLSVRDAFKISDDCELTLEANPGTVDFKKLSDYASLGVNRLSIGLQSIRENELKILGRIHSYSDFLSAYDAASKAGIDNINVDLMYAIPEQTPQSFQKTLEAMISLSPSHLSAYGLILEEGTPFFKRRGELTFPTEDEECEMYRLATDMLRTAGYSHYEISNYAREGKRSRHNLKYWRGQSYVGVGLAAHSYLDKNRYFNTEDISEYLSPDYAKYVKGEAVGPLDEAYEYAMMRLRLDEGISLSDYKGRFDRDFLSGKEEMIKKYVGAGLMRLSRDTLSFTESGFYVSNSLLTELL